MSIVFCFAALSVCVIKQSLYNFVSIYGHTRGNFSGGGEIAVECSPLLVAEIETKGRLGKVDGRFPHWVTPYVGDRYSLIYVSVILCIDSLK